MSHPFEVKRYRHKTLRDVLVAHSHRANPAVGDKAQVRFLYRCLDQRGCRSIVIEHDYTDRDFIEDFAAYYVRCFEPYSSKCTRLHFFKRDMDEASFSAAVISDAGSALQDDYLGFVVVKPLPLTVIGRSCLTTPGPSEDQSPVFPTTQTQPVDLYGLKLSVETLPFQEQDREVAACASSALWTMLHSTSRLFQHAMPSPVEITKAATTHARVDGRTFPNGGGLNPLQIADAIRSVGLEPFGIGVNSVPRLKVIPEEFADAAAGGGVAEPAQVASAERAAQMQLELKIAVLAYLRSGIACILLARTTDEFGALPPVTHGNHAVAITGYSLGVAAAKDGYRSSKTRFAAARLDRLYAHDDQTGPFASFTFEPDNKLVAVDYSAPEVSSRLAEPINLIVPLYHKIRIPLRQVVELVVALDEAFELIKGPLQITDRIEWDIELIGLEALRDDFSKADFAPEAKLELLTLALPRWVWRVRARLSDELLFDLLLDVTDLLQGDLLRRLVPYDVRLCQQIGRLLSLSQQLAATLRPTVAALRALKTPPTSRTIATPA